MAYNEFLGERLSNSLQKRGVAFEEKRMMGGLDLDEDLEYWVQLALDFNPRAKSSKK